MIKQADHSNIKWLIAFMAPLIIGTIAWAFQIERSISSINTSQVYTMNSIKEIREDIKEIRKNISGISSSNLVSSK